MQASDRFAFFTYNHKGSNASTFPLGLKRSGIMMTVLFRLAMHKCNHKKLTHEDLPGHFETRLEDSTSSREAPPETSDL